MHKKSLGWKASTKAVPCRPNDLASYSLKLSTRLCQLSCRKHFCKDALNERLSDSEAQIIAFCLINFCSRNHRNGSFISINACASKHVTQPACGATFHRLQHRWSSNCRRSGIIHSKLDFVEGAVSLSKLPPLCDLTYVNCFAVISQAEQWIAALLRSVAIEIGQIKLVHRLQASSRHAVHMTDEQTDRSQTTVVTSCKTQEKLFCLGRITTVLWRQPACSSVFRWHDSFISHYKLIFYEFFWRLKIEQHIYTNNWKLIINLIKRNKKYENKRPTIMERDK